jgi:hypothetical protein
VGFLALQQVDFPSHDAGRRVARSSVSLSEMASPRKPAKQSSGWGGFLQQAVASVESKLDNILADEEDRSSKASTSLAAAQDNVAPNRREFELRSPRL